jgi:transcriptional regulator with XRE-family HTH domain
MDLVIFSFAMIRHVFPFEKARFLSHCPRLLCLMVRLDCLFQIRISHVQVECEYRGFLGKKSVLKVEIHKKLTNFVMKYFDKMKTLIKNRRLQLNLKLKDLAAQMQIDSTLLSRFESGARIPTKAQVSLLAVMLDLPEDQLMMLWLRDRILADYGQEVSLPKALQLVQDSISEYSNMDPTPAASKSLLALLDRLDAMQQQWSSNRHRCIKRYWAL